MKKNYLSINILKVIACFLVIINHTSIYILEYNYNNNLLFYCIEYTICRVAVPLFLIITGYLLYQKHINFKYTYKKILRIFIPLFIISACIYFKKVDIFELKYVLLFIKEFLKNPILEPYWYLYMLIGLYLMLPLICNFVKKFNLHDYLYAIFILLFFPALVELFNFELSSYFSLSFFTYPVGYFIVGNFLHYIIDKNIFPNVNKWFLLVILIFLNSLGIYIMYINSSNEIYNIFLNSNSLLIILNSIISSLILIKYIKNKNDGIFVKMINTVASLTFGIYLVHPIIQNKLFYLNFLQEIIKRCNILGILLYQFILFSCCIFIIYILKKVLNLFIDKVAKKLI